jgi:hypothetical protein
MKGTFNTEKLFIGMNNVNKSWYFFLKEQPAANAILNIDPNCNLFKDIVTTEQYYVGVKVAGTNRMDAKKFKMNNANIDVGVLDIPHLMEYRKVDGITFDVLYALNKAGEAMDIDTLYAEDNKFYQCLLVVSYNGTEYKFPYRIINILFDD